MAPRPDRRVYIRVTKDDINNLKYELMHNGEKLWDVTGTDVLEMGLQFLSSTRFEIKGMS